LGRFLLYFTGAQEVTQEIVEKETVKSLSRKRREHKELISFNVFFVFFFLNDFTLDSFIPFLGQRFFNETIVDQENERI